MDREHLIQLVMEQLADFSSPEDCARQLAPQVGVDAETLRGWIAHTRSADMPDDPAEDSALEELRRLRAEVRDLRKANEVLQAATAFFVRELDQRVH